MTSPAAAAYRSLLAGVLERRGEAARPVEDTDRLLQVGGRIVQVRLDEAGRLHLSTMVFYNDGDPDPVLDAAIAEFNAFHLVAGGYCLMVDERSLSLWVDQAVSVHRFDPDAFLRHLADFADRAATCARWYGRLVAEHASAAA